MDDKIMREAITIILIYVVTAGLMAPLIWLTLWMGRHMREGSQDAVRAAASHFGLQPEPIEAAAELGIVSPDAVYKGIVDGVEVSLTASARVAHVGSPGTALPLAYVTVPGWLPTPLPFDLHIARVANPPGPVIRSGDAQFDRYAKVSTNDERAVRELLASAMLRSMIQRFVQEGLGGHAVVTKAEVRKNVFDAHLKGESSVIQSVKDVVALAKAVGHGGRFRRHEAEPATQPLDQEPLIRNWREDFPERLKSKLSRFKYVRCGGVLPVAEGVSLGEAHHFVLGRDISSYDTPRGFPRRSEKEKTPEGLLRVEIECDTGVFRDPRNTEWCTYNGYFLSLLVFAELGDIWDARWEPT